MYTFLIRTLQVIATISAVLAGFFVCSVDGNYPVNCAVAFAVCLAVSGCCLKALEHFWEYENDEEET